MKKKYGIILLIIGLFIFIPNVKAEDFDEFGIIIQNNTIVISNENGEDINVSDTNAIYSWDNDTSTLTLKEGIHYIGVTSSKNVTITSNDSLVYINYIVIEGIATLNHLNSSSYTSKATQALAYDDDASTPLQTIIRAQELHINNSTVKLNAPQQDDRELHNNKIRTMASSNTNTYPQVGNGNMTITDSTVETDSMLIVVDESDLTITRSNVKAYVLGTDGESIQSDVTITDNSTVTLLHNEIYTVNLMVSGDFVNAGNTLAITDSTLITNGLVNATIIELTDSELLASSEYKNYHVIAILSNETYLTRSTVDVAGPVATKVLDMNKSTLECKSASSEEFKAIYNRDFGDVSPLILGSLRLQESDIRAVSENEVPAFLVGELPVVDKSNLIYINDNFKIGELTKVTFANYGFTPTGSTNIQLINTILDSVTQGYTVLVNDAAVHEVTTATSVEVTLKIQNGTWEDGTTEDIHVTMIEGITPSKNDFKTISSIENGVLTIKETGENEYTFVYSEKKSEANPKTGVKSFVILLVISFIGILYLNNFSDKLSFFKKI